MKRLFKVKFVAEWKSMLTRNLLKFDEKLKMVSRETMLNNVAEKNMTKILGNNFFAFQKIRRKNSNVKFLGNNNLIW